MGADTFTQYEDGTDLTTAFKKAVSDARWNYGNAGYTGTIAEKDRVVAVEEWQGSDLRAGVPLGLAKTLARQMIEEEDPRVDDKWGPAAAIKVKDDVREGWLFFGWASS